MAITALITRPESAITAITDKGRPEQGHNGATARNGTVTGDTGCGTAGTDQRVMTGPSNGPGDELRLSVHGCSQE